MDTLIVTAAAAIEQGSTPGSIRVIANSVERLGRDWNTAASETTHRAERNHALSRARVNFQNAHALRRTASIMEKMLRGK